jgi:hypothetical protein
VDACGVVCVLLFLLPFLAIGGYLLWVVVAPLLRAPAESSAPPRERGSPEPQAYAARQLRELDGAARQVAWLAQMGRLSPKVSGPVLDALKQRQHELRQLLDGPPGSATQAKPEARRDIHPSPTLPPDGIVSSPAPAAQPPATGTEEVLWAVPAEAVPEGAAAAPPAPAAPSPRQPAPTSPPPPRRSFREMMAAFMEERNILWGELVGGLLIVGCSIALVISLRETLQELPYFPFLIVGALTAALIGAGRYTLSHWKLESTSRGLLVIGTMMVPLSFMVLAGLAGGHERGALEVATEAAALVLFTWLVRGATDILMRPAVGPAAPRPDWLTTAATLGTSASLLLVPHVEQGSDPTSGLLGLVGYVPAVLFVVTQGLAWYAVYRRDAISARQAGGLFLGLGLSAYALALAFVFLLFRSENVSRALEYLAVPVALAGLFAATTA